MEFALLLPPAIALLAWVLPRPRARMALSGGVVVALALASLAVAGGADWRGANLPASYLATTAALLLLGLTLVLGATLLALRAAETSPLRWVTGVLCLAVLGPGLWITAPLAVAGGLIRTLITLGTLALVLAVLGWLSRVAGLTGRFRRLDHSLFHSIKPASSPQWPAPDAGLLSAHLALAISALFAPHLLLLLGAVLGAVVTGVLLERRLDRSLRWPWAVGAGLLLLAVVGGFTVQVAGEVPLALEQLRDGPFSPAFEVIAVVGWLIAAWPLLGLWPFHATPRGPATAVAGAAIILRVAVPIMPGGVEHWQPLLFPVLVLSAWYAAGLGTVRLALVAVATGGLISLRPSAAWAGVVLLLSEAAVSISGRFTPSRRFAPVVAALATVLVLNRAVPLLTGALQAQTFYSVVLAVGLGVALWVDEPGEDLTGAR